MVLDEILKLKKAEVARAKRLLPLSKLKRALASHKRIQRSLEQALLRNHGIHLICELKQASPSEGILRRNFDLVRLAKQFEAAGASAISVLTERNYFKGDPVNVRRVREHTSIPVLRKDFILEPYQVYESAYLGADAVLLITMLASEDELKRMIRLAADLGLDALVEVHTEPELNRALRSGGRIIGINNRNLRTLQVDLSAAEKLIRRIPKGLTAVVESGIDSRRNIDRYWALGARAFLVGSALMKAKNVKRKIHELMGTNDGRRQCQK